MLGRTTSSKTRPRRSRPSLIAGLFILAFVVCLGAGLYLAVASRGPESAVSPVAGSDDGAEESDLLPTRLVDVRQYRGPSFGLSGHHATQSQNQSKLWYAAGSWWGVLLDERSQTTRIFKWSGHTWRDTGVVVDLRARSYADVVWERGQLFIASRISNGSSYLTHFRLEGGTWKSVTAFPRTIARGGSRSLSIAVDSRERVWAVFVRDGRVWLTHSAPGGSDFVPETLLPGPNAVHYDDTAAVAALRGQIVLMWSDQVTGAFRFAIRRDEAPTDEVNLGRPPMRGLRIADGHLDLATTRDGRLIAAVKTSLGDADRDPPRSPLIVVLERSAKGTWSRHVVATTADAMTRPQMVLTADQRTLFLFAASPQKGGDIYLKVASLKNLSFAPGKGTLIMRRGPAGKLNDVTTGRTRVSNKTRVVVLASDAPRARYHTTEFTISKQ